ncbi:hypothetical protein Ciccas_009584 [Cichlidogyrus casuarinus]|uniref:Uncharacterized protein n=1 Tax=Cichlidogyrus casuarinus TaxID=1844966 RepID=A0ABD2PWL9_9PLAT
MTSTDGIDPNGTGNHQPRALKQCERVRVHAESQMGSALLWVHAGQVGSRMAQPMACSAALAPLKRTNSTSFAEQQKNPGNPDSYLLSNPGLTVS